MIELHLEDILQIYRDTLSSGSLLVNGFFTRVVPTKDGTAAISKNGTFYYCPAFFEKHITSPEKLKDIVLHEMGHPVIADLSREPGYWGNVAGDAVINAMLVGLKLCRGDFFRDYYSSSLYPDCFLRPGSRPPAEAFGLYGALYPEFVSKGLSLVLQNPLEVITAIKILMKDQEIEVNLLGSHGIGDSSPTETIDGEAIDPDDLSLPGDVTADISEGMKAAGKNSKLNPMFMNILDAHVSLKTEILTDFASKRAAARIISYFKVHSPVRSPVPVTMSRNEAVQAASGYPPLFYRRPRLSEERSANSKVDIYLDVSGSVWRGLPKVLGILRCLRREIGSVNQFSNKVYESSIDQLEKGEIVTTGGTDFDCVIEHAVSKGYRKVLVFTDGFGGVNEQSKRKAIQHIDKMCLVYFAGTGHNWIKEHYGQSYLLEEILR